MRISDWSSDVCSSDLDHLIHRGDDPSIGQHRFDSQHLLTHHAVADEAHSASVGRRVAAKLARPAPAHIERKLKPVLIKMVLQCFHDYNSLNDSLAVVGIDNLDRIHVLKRQKYQKTY